MRPRLLDLYCCAGGAGFGYHLPGSMSRAWIRNPSPGTRYDFIQADAIEVLADRDFLAQWDAIHRSPPCQDHARWRRFRSGWQRRSTRR